MKKIIFPILCILMSVIFISCSKNVVTHEETNKDNIITSENSDTKQDNSNATNNTDVQNGVDTSLQNISKMYLDYDGFKVDLDITDEMISDLSEIQNAATVPNTELNNAFAIIHAVYNDNSDKVFGTIYIGDDNAFYLKCENTPNKDAAYKLADNFLPNNSISDLN